jgi:hypothetical protein
MEKYRVTLDVQEHAPLEHLISTGKAASFGLAHTRILLLANALHGKALGTEEILIALVASLRTIARVRERFITERIESALGPRPRRIRSDEIKIKAGFEQKLNKPACTYPPHWRRQRLLSLLATEMVVFGPD